MKNLTIRIYPNQEQEQLMWRHIGACRFIWNWSLETQINEYDETQHRIGATKMCKKLTDLKKQEDFQWLNDISITSLQQTIRELDRTFNDWFVVKDRGKPVKQILTYVKYNGRIGCQQFNMETP